MKTTVHLMSGARVGVRADGRVLTPFHSDGSAPLPEPTTFPHNILGVFPTAGDAEPTGRAYVLLNGPDPLVELDVVGRQWRAVLSAATQDAYLKRWSSSAMLTNLVPSARGRFVAVALNDGHVALHKICSDHGKPTFEMVDMWTFRRGAIVYVTGVATDPSTTEEVVQSVSFVVARPEVAAEIHTVDISVK